MDKHMSSLLVHFALENRNNGDWTALTGDLRSYGMETNSANDFMVSPQTPARL